MKYKKPFMCVLSDILIKKIQAYSLYFGYLLSIF